jgi:GNAT superfamily N-acetyltransferase
MSIDVRPARPSDAERVAALSGQLGYSCSPQEMEERLRRLERAEGHAMFVAERSREVVGWVHIHVSSTVTTPTQAEVLGLVVEEACRGGGVGRVLMRRAEQWAREHRCRVMWLRSNVIRAHAHAFYRRLGYAEFKTQKNFRKELA